MNTRTKTIFGLGAALSAALFGGIFAVQGGLTASAVAEPSLFLPGSYEEYLPLEDPSDAAMNGEIIAVADGSTFYL